jgi:hypothetical protein
MNMDAGQNWIELNQRLLSAELARLRERLERYAEQADPPAPEANAAPVSEPAPLLQRVAALFGLSRFERDILLLCAGIELDARFPTLCAAAHGDARRSYPSFSLALAVLPDAHWSALAPDAPLRRWQLIDVMPGECLTLSPLRIDERVLHYVAGVFYVDSRLRDLLRPLPSPGEIPPSHQRVVQRIGELWADADAPLATAVGLWGAESAAKRAIAAAACNARGYNALALRVADLPTPPAERHALLRLWQRELLLSDSVPVLDDDGGDAAGVAAVVDALSGPVIVLARDAAQGVTRPLLGIDVDKPTAAEQRELWQQAVGGAAAPLNGALDVLTGQFNLDAAAIRVAAGEARVHETVGHNPQGAQRRLWQAARGHARPRLQDLAQHIEPVAGWDDLVLPPAQKQILHDVVAGTRQRYKVYESWGMARGGNRGLGLSTLFAGHSGTGKTLAAEVVAHALDLDLYRIDLSRVVSKYIGETEKNLRRVFDAAEEGGAVLLFDEADALFGKRSEVRDSHDRYANIEVSYLLQRMESYRGLAILTSNMKAALDTAFLRRLRFVVQFPFPDAAQRAEIWRRAYPAGTPTEGLDLAKLARLNVAGGNIRNIALTAAFLAADAGEPVRMSHLLRAARSEYAKLDRPLGEAEAGGWG